ncbi:WD40-repeat-containing domain protein [Dactylonectria estremocensis]|uniref:WD40-repeat-containing domain protein n=1 Tax=Dactylonectria estremocensis TaxID=1079267 RepID=A0A9P9JI35_9HYPO|nr:WD40-repeat-containing domain protein [Dactylonectria estremocensis]
MTRRIFPVSDWAPVQEAMMDPSSASAAESSTAGESADAITHANASATTTSATAGPFATPTNSHRDLGATGATNAPRHRSLSVSLPWRRPKSFAFGHDNLHHLPRHFNELAIDDTEEETPESTNGQIQGQSHHQAHHSQHQHHHHPGSIKGIFRRASLSLKGMVHRRASTATEDNLGQHDAHHSAQHGWHGARPTTSHTPSTWNRLRQAASFRHSRAFFDQDLDLSQEPTAYHHPHANSFHLPIPGFGGEPPVIPTNSGAAAKASAAMQNEYLARQGLQNLWLNPRTSDDGNDRESGIGITVTVPGAEADTESDLGFDSGSTISKIDFISKLPTELAIHVLASLDAASLVKASEVSHGWKKVISNQHIWRESCLREMTTTYATSGPVTPGTGLGIPPVSPSNDWKEIYRVKQELTYRWKAGKARPVYLNGHSDSIYCLQFDEYKIITGSRDKTIRVWDMRTLECQLVIGPPEVINEGGMLVDDEGLPTHYAAGSDNERTSTSMPTLISFPTHHKASILCLQYDDEILVTGSSDSSCIVYDVRAGYRPIRRLRHHTSPVLDLAFDDKHIVTCSKDTSICVWDRETGALLRQLRGHGGPVNAVQMRANTIVSCSGDFRVKLWNIDTGKNIREFAGHTKGLACSQFSEDGRYIASAGNDKVIRIWDANTGECLREMRAHENLVRSLHIDSVSGRLISGSYDTDIKVWDMETGHQLLDFPRWHASWVLSAKSDYRRIVSTGQDPKILIMDFGADVKGIDMLESDRHVEPNVGFI